MIPPRATMLEDADWITGAWSAQKSYAFETGLTQSEYLEWARRAIGSDWHCRIQTDGVAIFTRLLPTEQESLELRQGFAVAGRSRMRVIFIALPT